MKPRLLDLFCGAGGASVGYGRAGFEVVGVDLYPQPNYPYEFHQGDALKFLLENWREFDALHGSPPCQRHSAMSSCRPGLAESYPDYITATREAFSLIGLPWVIENVVGSPLRPDLVLCGHMFGLKLYRHRIFEVGGVYCWQPEHPRHVTPGSRAGHWVPGTIISVSGNCAPINLGREAMGIDWMNRAELAESIPPAYTEHIGRQLIDHLEARSAA